jgi:hypothetical protein
MKNWAVDSLSVDQTDQNIESSGEQEERKCTCFLDYFLCVPLEVRELEQKQEMPSHSLHTCNGQLMDIRVYFPRDAPIKTKQRDEWHLIVLTVLMNLKNLTGFFDGI